MVRRQIRADHVALAALAVLCVLVALRYDVPHTVRDGDAVLTMTCDPPTARLSVPPFVWTAIMVDDHPAPGHTLTAAQAAAEDSVWLASNPALLARSDDPNWREIGKGEYVADSIAPILRGTRDSATLYIGPGPEGVYRLPLKGLACPKH